MIDLRGQLPVAPQNGHGHRPPSAIRRIVVHWDGGAPIPEGYSPPVHYANESRYHISKDWDPMARGVQGGYSLMYHAKVARDGTVYLTRDPEDICWAAINANQDGFMICVDCTQGQGPTPAQETSLKWLLDQQRGVYHLDRGAVLGHQEVPGNQTECPGAHLLGWVRGYRQGG